MKKITRRTFVLGSIASGVTGLLLRDSRLSASTLGNKNPLAIEQALRFPPVFSGTDLIINQTSVNIWTDKPTTALTFNGSFPGPTIIVNRGDTFTANVTNLLKVPSVIHWHGLLVPELMDGHPKDQIAPGKSEEISFPVLNRAGTYFYHSHAHEETASQVYKGLAGFFIVEDDAEKALGLPSGTFDVPLLIQDKRSNANRDLVYSPSMMDSMNGYLGTDILINGTPDAYLNVSNTLYRFRLLNGSNARIYKIAFSTNTPFQVIGGDGGLLDNPIDATSAFLSPGERLDILVDFSKFVGQNVYLKSLAFPYQNTMTSGKPQGTEMNLLKLVITDTIQSGAIAPTSLPMIEKYNPTFSKRTRTFALAMSGMTHTINNKTFAMDRIDETVKLGEIERWDFINNGDETHPIHIHNIQFQVFERDGKTTTEPNDLGWKDTVMVPGMSVVSILVRFDIYDGRYLLHCHNLEHEDTGMMQNIQVVPALSVNKERDSDSVLTITPNQATNKTTLHFKELEANLLLEVISMDGRTILQTVIDKGSKKYILDVSTLTIGMYLVRMGTLRGNLNVIR